MTQEIDKQLQEGGIHFLPYIGDNYNDGISYDNEGNIIFGGPDAKKILVLGESHYVGDPDDDTPEITRNVLNYYLRYMRGEEEFEPWMNTFTKFGRALTGSIDKDAVIKAYEHVAFYNYVQVPLTGARLSPSPEMFRNSEKTLFPVLQELKPDIVLVWGKRLYCNLPEDGVQGDDIITDDEEIETWLYEAGDKKVVFVPILHPSAGFDWEYYHYVIFYLY